MNLKQVWYLSHHISTLLQWLPKSCRHRIPNSLRFQRCTCTPTHFWLQWNTHGDSKKQRLCSVTQCSSIRRALNLNLHSHLFVLELSYINEKYSCRKCDSPSRDYNSLYTGTVKTWSQGITTQVCHFYIPQSKLRSWMGPGLWVSG